MVSEVKITVRGAREIEVAMKALGVAGAANRIARSALTRSGMPILQRARELVPVRTGELRKARPDRLLWGSDWPHAINKKPMANDGDLFDHVAAWLPEERLREQVLALNPKRPYGFD